MLAASKIEMFLKIKKHFLT